MVTWFWFGSEFEWWSGQPFSGLNTILISKNVGVFKVSSSIEDVQKVDVVKMLYCLYVYPRARS